MAPARTVEIRFTGSTAQLEAALARAGLVADESGRKIGDSFTAGTSKAGGALSKLANIAGSWGIPFAGHLDTVGKKLDEATTKTSRFSTALAEAGKVTLVAGTAGFAGAAAEATKLGEAFQTATASIAANAGITQKAADGIGHAFLDTAGKSIFSGQQMASAFASVAGQLKLTEGQALSSADALKVMTAAGNLAEASHETLANSTAALASVMQAYRLSVNQAASASDTLFNVSKSINVPVAGVAQALERLHGRLGELAPSLSDVSGLLVDLAGHGITGQRGVQVVNTALQTLVGNSKNTKAVLHDLGVSVFDSSGRFVGLQSVIQQLQPKLAGLTQQQQIFVTQTLFGKSAAQVMQQVIADGIGKFQAATDAATKLGTAHQAASLQSKTLHNQLETLKATVQDLGTKFGLWLIPKLEAVGQALSSGIQWLEKHKAAAQALAAVITGVLGVAVATFAYQKAVAFVGAVGNMGKALLGLGAQSTATATTVEAADATIVESADATAAGVDAAIGSTGIGLVIVALGVAITELATHWTTAWNNIKSITQDVVNFVVSGINSVIGSINDLISAYNSLLGWATGNIGSIGTIGNVNLTGGGGGPDVRQVKGSVAGFSSMENQNAGLILGQLTNGGLSQSGAAALVGNWVQESNLNPGAPGGGLAQWIGGRNTALWSYAKARGENAMSLPTQVGFALTELKSQFPGLWSMLVKGGDPAALALAVSNQYERPAAWAANNKGRENYAQEVFSGFFGGGGGITSVPSPGISPIPNIPTPSGNVSLPSLTALMNNPGGTKAHHHASTALSSLQKLFNAAAAMMKLFGDLAQTGTLKALENSLGVSTGGAMGSLLHNRIESLGSNASTGRIDSVLGSAITKASAGSQQTKAFDKVIAELQSSGQNGLAKQLVAAHKAAMAALAQEMYVAQATKDAESLNLQATQLRDQTQQAQNYYNDQLNLAKAQQQKVQDATAEQVTAIKDMTQIMQDQGQMMVQSIQDAAQAMTDSLDAVATGINDQTQIKVDLLGERGLYGLNLIAQQQRVSADEVKAFWDQQIATAKQNLDAVTQQQHQQVALAQINVDQVQQLENLKVAAAQQADDLVNIKMSALIAQAQAHDDAVLLHQDASVVGPAQIAVDLGATLPKAQQDVLNAQLKRALGTAGVAEARANRNLANVTAFANAAMNTAQNAYASAEAQANLAIAQAGQALTAAQVSANEAIQTAQGALAQAQGNAAVAEAQATGTVSVTSAQAQTQYAGSGLVVNLYGVDVSNSQAIAAEMGWVWRTQMSIPG